MSVLDANTEVLIINYMLQHPSNFKKHYRKLKKKNLFNNKKFP